MQIEGRRFDGYWDDQNRNQKLTASMIDVRTLTVDTLVECPRV